MPSRPIALQNHRLRLACFTALAFLGAVTLHAQPTRPTASPRIVQPFDHDWRFIQHDVDGGASIALNDVAWTHVDLPHDWAIFGPFAATNPSGGAGAFAPEGIGWYRKHFTLPATDRARRVFIELDGVMANSDVWINGVPLGHRPNGYVSLRYELTGHLNFGPNATNVLAVRADNSKQPASRFYEGAGIYRHVRLVLENPVHTTGSGTFVTTTDVSRASAVVHVQSEVRNDSATDTQISIKATLIDPHGKPVATMRSKPQPLAANQQQTIDVSQTVPTPDLWDIDHPALYTVQVDVLANNRVTDREPVRIGIREFHFDAATGFWLNGRNLKLKGVALHSDVGSLGMAAPLGAWEHRLNAMRQMGANAIRTAHNPVSPDFLDLCDRMGFLVMDEMFDQWTVAKNPYDYHLYFREWNLADTRDTVRRDRNHPSIILYSAGNEIHDTPKPELAKPILAALVAEFHKDDPTRPVTQALFRPNVSHDYEDGLADLLDVVGQNYRTNEILAAHAQKPNRKIVGTENGHDRGSWLDLRDHPEYSGQFLWAGTDYLGESRRWPIIGDGSGMYDRTDAPKPDGLERQSWWSDTPVVHIARRTAPTQPAPTDPGYEQEQYRPKQVVFADWSPTNLQPHDEQVEVYSNCQTVELALNGQSLGSKPINTDASARKWTVPFAAGALTAIGTGPVSGTAAGAGSTSNAAASTSSAASCATETLRTAGKPAKLQLTIERGKLSTSWDDVAYVRAIVTDDKGTPIPNASNMLHFRTAGPGKILTTDSADNVYQGVFQSPDRAAFKGSAIAILRATAPAGHVTLTVSAEGLKPSSVSLPVTRTTP
jgi:beta-galactosidase